MIIPMIFSVITHIQTQIRFLFFHVFSMYVHIPPVDQTLRAGKYTIYVMFHDFPIETPMNPVDFQTLAT